jgi:2-C-methyl-D-erythritol 4-phosphate cytidylyltransferase
LQYTISKNCLVFLLPMQIHAVIVAGGSGTRMQADMPKQFLMLHNKAVLLHSIEVMQQCKAKIYVVVHSSYEQYTKDLLEKNNFSNIEVVLGGSTRFESVQNGISAIKGEAHDIVLVHDAARPFITISLIERIVASVNANNCVIPVISIFDSIRIIENQTSTAVDRNLLKIVQTPQAAQLGVFQVAFAQNYKEAFTDEATVCEAAGFKVILVDGLEQNIKITTMQNLIDANSK